LGQEGPKEHATGIILDVELDADLPEVALDDALNVKAIGVGIWCCRVLELQALSTFGTYPIGASHPAVIVQQFIGRRQVKQRAVGIWVVARMIGRGMVGAQRHGEALEWPSDDGLLIYRHGHRLAHFQVVGQDLVMKVKVQRLKAALYRSIDECIVLEAL